MFDIEESHENVASVLNSNVTVHDGMALLIEFCATRESWRGWSSLRKLDFDSDQSSLRDWLNQLLTAEPPQNTVKAFWFGLFNPVVKGKTGCGLYAAGADQFDAADDTFDWACDPSYFPDGRYAPSRVLNEIYHKVSVAKGSIPSYGEYVLCLGYAGLAVKQLALTLAPSLWLGAKAKRSIAVGFDSGDGILIGSITKRGWTAKAA